MQDASSGDLRRPALETPRTLVQELEWLRREYAQEVTLYTVSTAMCGIAALALEMRFQNCFRPGFNECDDATGLGLRPENAEAA